MNHYLLASCLAVLLSMTATWYIQLKTKNAGIVDVTWSYNFALLGYLVFIFGDGAYDRKVLLTSLVLIWSIRLGTYLYRRNVGKAEDVRYAQLRIDWGKAADIKMLFFFYFQAIFNLVLALPFVLIAFNKDSVMHWNEYLGAALVIIAVIGESLSDWQLKQFKKDPKNKGQVCEAGLWNYSRHPNYFFEWLVWVGFLIMALSAPYGYLAIVSPALILWTLLKMTGIPMTEELAVKSKGDLYRNYQRSTSPFIPLPKRHKA